MREKIMKISAYQYRKFSLILILSITGIMSLPVSVSGQADKKFIRQGNREYEKKQYSESEISYRKAIDKNKQSADAVFNAGDALYKQKKFEDAGKQFMDNINMNENNKKKSAGLYNLGNSLLKANKLEESIDAYKGSLRLDPKNPEAKYNLAYAQDLLRQQQQQQQQKQNQQQQQNNKDQNKDQDKEKEQDQNKDQNQQQQQQKDNQTISKEDAERILNALENDEKNVQEKVKLAKAAKERVRSAKNW
ncbi:MAG TPA: tetratricopeptide repeat protein [Bacteroidales bacterium]|jgi:tetratricopeptide (TPR) repeat protein|nr:MAG: Tetratricopeptide repeat protein [Bacteroidetes bacterium ADurb.Bin145]HOU02124.1 tetratricopeptide repeat protein [Bacteroidales bacterium]HQG62162.1 tetratricopeptide repeat protein [Bacteroidales bacterium]HQK67496.1 tetratricopeptide repeat protein [Bacteroidales bacterium]